MHSAKARFKAAKCRADGKAGKRDAVSREADATASRGVDEAFPKVAFFGAAPGLMRGVLGSGLAGALAGGLAMGGRRASILHKLRRSEKARTALSDAAAMAQARKDAGKRLSWADAAALRDRKALDRMRGVRVGTNADGTARTGKSLSFKGDTVPEGGKPDKVKLWDTLTFKHNRNRILGDAGMGALGGAATGIAGRLAYNAAAGNAAGNSLRQYAMPAAVGLGAGMLLRG